MDLSGFCTGVKPVLQAAGWLLLIFKIIIPLIPLNNDFILITALCINYIP